jgi:hypothetical protein
VTASLKFTNQLNDLDIIQGSNGVLSVECEGVPKPKLTWYVNRSHQLNNLANFIFVFKGILMIMKSNLIKRFVLIQKVQQVH